jgi:hypothetical protein
MTIACVHPMSTNNRMGARNLFIYALPEPRPDGGERSSNLFLYHDFLTAPSVMQPEMLLGFKFVLE